MNGSYPVTNPEIAAFVLGMAVIAISVWLLTPSATYRITHRWLRENGQNEAKKWLYYWSFKSFFNPADIAMNAVNNPEFTPDDLMLLNRLFEKLGQPAAEFIRPETGDGVDPSSMEIQNKGDAIPDQLLVLDALTTGVRWKGGILKKASIVQCGPDFLMMHRLMDHAEKDEIVSAFLEYCESKDLLDKGYKLGAGELKGFIDTQMRADKTRALFEALRNAHPDHCFELIEPSPGAVFDNDTMVPLAGSVPGQRSIVTETRRCGIARTSHPKWIIKALVKI